MYVRCGDCRHATWLEPIAPGSSAGGVCAGCGKKLTVRGSARLGSGPHEQFRNALDFANHHRLDLPSAWSVLADLMTLEEAHACRADMGLERPNESPQAGRPGRPKSAAAEDTETESGEDAGAEAQRLARRHGLPLAVAARVMQGALTLPAALLLKPTLIQPSEPAAASAGQTEVPPRRRVAPPGLVTTAAIATAGVLLLAGIWLVRPRAEADGGAPALRSAPANTEIRRDAAGHPVEIAGPDPESVLIAYCNREDPSERCRPLKLVLGSPPRAGTRWGIFEEPGDPEALHAIEIRRQGEARRWVAGDGEARIRTIDPPEPASGAAELPAPAL